MISDEVKKYCEVILEYLAVKDLPRKADVIFTAGGKTLAPVEKAAQIFKEGYSSKIVFVSKNGKFTNPSWKDEATEYRKKFIELGVANENLYSEALSTNTLEEVKMAIPFMEIRKIEHQIIILTARPFHQRRVWATFQKQFPDFDYINIPADNDFDWEMEGITRLIGEVERLDTYAEKGDIKKQPIPEEIRSAVTYLKDNTKTSV